MKNWKKDRTNLYLLLSGIIIVPLLNHYLKLLGQFLNIKLGIGTSVILWLIIDFIIILIKKNIVITKQNSKIEVDGVNLKKKDRNVWNSRLGNERRNRTIFEYW